MYRWLFIRASEVAKIYAGALHIIEENLPIPGREHFVAHAAREIFNSAVEIKLREVREAGTRTSRTSPQDRMNGIASAWDKYGMADASLLTDRDKIPTTTSVDIPVAVYRLIDRHIRDHIDYGETNRKRFIRIIRSIASSLVSEADVDEEASDMIHLSGRIMKMVHVDRDGKRDPISFGWDTLTEDFQRIESHLLAVVRPATTLMRNDLDEVLEETNA